MLNRSASLAMSTSVLKALPGKLDIKRHSPSILYVQADNPWYNYYLLNHGHVRSYHICKTHMRTLLNQNYGIILSQFWRFLEAILMCSIQKFGRSKIYIWLYFICSKAPFGAKHPLRKWKVSWFIKDLIMSTVTKNVHYMANSADPDVIWVYAIFKCSLF